MLTLSTAYNSDIFNVSEDFQFSSLDELLGAREDFIDIDLYDCIADADAKFIQIGKEGLLDGIGEAIANFFSGLFQAIERLLDSLFGGGSGGGSSGSSSKGSVTHTLSKNKVFIKKIEKLCDENPDTEIKLPKESINQGSFDVLYKLQLDLVTWKEELQNFSVSKNMPSADLFKKLVSCSNYKELHELENEISKIKISDVNSSLQKLVMSKTNITNEIPDIKTLTNLGGFGTLERLGLKFNPEGSTMKAQQAMDYLKDLYAADDDQELSQRDLKVDKEFQTTMRLFKRYRRELSGNHGVKYDEAAADNPSFVDGEPLSKFSHKGAYSGVIARTLLTKRIGFLRSKLAGLISVWFKWMSGFRLLNGYLKTAKRESERAIKNGFTDFFNSQQTGTESMISIYKKLGGE